MHRLAIVASHPIQYQAPWFRALATVTDLTVFFCHRQDAKGQADAGFGVAFEWDVPLLEGYRSRWLTNVAAEPGVSSFRGCDTPEIADEIARGEFGACIVSGWYLKSYLQAIRACRKHGVKLMVRGDSQLATPRSRAVALAKHLPYRWLLQRFDAHLYVGERNREYLVHYGVEEDRLFHVPHFVDNAFFAARAEEARRNGTARALRAELGCNDRSMVVLFAGKLIEKKRTADLIKAARLARSTGLDVRAIVVGSGPLETDLRSLARNENVPALFTGFRNQSEIPTCFAAADAIALPSDGGETWGLVVNEAMACGLPALVSRAAGCGHDLVSNGETGYVFETGNIQAFADAMRALHCTLDESPDRLRTSVAARIKRYSVEAAVGGTLRALDAVTARTRHGHQPQAAALPEGTR